MSQEHFQTPVIQCSHLPTQAEKGKVFAFMPTHQSICTQLQKADIHNCLLTS